MALLGLIDKNINQYHTYYDTYLATVEIYIFDLCVHIAYSALGVNAFVVYYADLNCHLVIIKRSKSFRRKFRIQI